MADILTPDLCVVGAGSGGLAVAEEAAAFGASVVVVERARLGGNALHAGAVPARALVAAAAHAEAMRSGTAFGITGEEPRIAFRKVRDHVGQVIEALTPDRSAAHYAAMGVQLLEGEARFLDRRSLAVGDTQVRARRFVLATGARAVVPPIPGLEQVPYFTTDTILDNTRKLTHLVVIGAGAIGLELAQAYRRLGTEVTVVEAKTPLPGIDPELAAVLLARLREEGIAIREMTEVTEIQPRSMGTGVAIRSAAGDELLDVSHILVATGRLPNLEGLDLDKAEIRRSKLDPQRLEVDAGLRTTNRRVFAIGDVAGGEPSAASARHQAGLVVRRALFGLPVRHDPARVPRVTWTDPEIAEVGLSERSARVRHGTRFRVTRIGFSESDLARARRQTHGFAKLVTTPWGRILGASVVGPGAGELIALFSLAVANRLTLVHLARMVAPYPALAELAERLGAEAIRARASHPLLRRWLALVRLLG